MLWEVKSYMQCLNILGYFHTKSQISTYLILHMLSYSILDCIAQILHCIFAVFFFLIIKNFIVYFIYIYTIYTTFYTPLFKQ